MNLHQQAKKFISTLPAPGRSKDGAVVHDYTLRGPGHDYNFNPRNDGLEASMIGWGRGIKDGDYLILAHQDGDTTRYRVKSINYFMDPRDMWKADVEFAPRSREEKGE